MRKQIKIKAFVALTLLFAFFFSTTSTVFGATGNLRFNHVLLGDSIGAGQTPYGIEKSYSYGNALQNLLAKEGVAGSYDNFAVSGMTSDTLLDQLDPTDGDMNAKMIRKIMAGGENGIVTLNIGANDLLPLLIAYSQGNVSLESIVAQLESTLKNIGSIVLVIQGLNPDAEIYVMGFYNAFVNYQLTLEQSFMVSQLLGIANGAIASLGANPYLNVTYVSLFDVVTSDMLPGDIHPNKTGYRAIGEAIFDEIYFP